MPKICPRFGGGRRMGVVRNGGVQLPRERSQPPSGESLSCSAAKGCGTNGPVTMIGIFRPPTTMVNSAVTPQPWKADVSITI